MLKLKEHKEPQHHLESEKYLKPKKLYLPLSQHTGAPGRVCVQPKDIVEEAAVLAHEDGFISARLHSPACAKVSNIDYWLHPVLKRAMSVILECTGEDKRYQARNVNALDKVSLLEIIKNSGIVGMGGAAFPTHVKLSPPKKIDTFIVNGAECEPYLATDYRLMVENLEGIFKGIEIVCKIVEPQHVLFVVEENKPEAIKKINLFITTKRFNLPGVRLVVLKSLYPHGGEKQQIYAVTKRKVPPGKLPFDIGCLVHNVATLFAIYEAVYYNKPLIERLVSFCGDALVSPKNIWVKIGTSLAELFEAKVLEFKYEPKKIIAGGPMMGISVDNLQYPILKGTGGFLFLKDTVSDQEETPCIRCARCVDACPVNLLPLEYAKRVKYNVYDSLSDFAITDCIECGCCNYVCPAHIPLVHYIKIGKAYAPKSK